MLVIKYIKRIIGGCKSLLRYVINKRRFKRCTRHSNIIKPFIATYDCISMGRAYILNNARIEGVKKYNNVYFNPEIVIGDGVSIQQNLHLTCANKIVIGKNTAIAANVTITDIHHPYTDINVPIERQNIEVKEVIIGEECKIYNGAVILPGAHIGNHVSIGANSVVNKDIPDFCVVAGAPARIIKRYNPEANEWQKTDKQGNFLEQ